MRTSFIYRVLASLFLALPSFAGWHSYAWENYRYGTNPAPVVTQIWATVHSVVVTNYVTNSPVLTTNRFINDARFWQSTTSNVSGTNTITAYSNGAPLVWSYVYSLPLVATNAALQAREIVGRDAFGSIKERTQALTDGAGVLSALASFPSVYRKERDQLVFVKQWIADNVTNFVNVSASTNRDFYVDYFKTNAADVAPMMTLTGLVALVGSPTNYFAYTPWRELWPIDTGVVSVSTCLVTFANATTSAVTNAFTDCCGRTNSLVLTNGQVGTIVCTSDYIQAGFTSSDYGWKRITNMLSLLVHTISAPCGGNTTDRNRERVLYNFENGPGCTSLVTAIATATNAWKFESGWNCDGTTGAVVATEFGWTADTSCGFPQSRWYSLGYTTNSGFTRAFAQFQNDGARIRYSVGTSSTGITHVADLYNSVSTNYPSAAVITFDAVATWSNTVFQYDDNGLGFTTNKTIFGAITNAGVTTNAILFGDNPMTKMPIPTKPDDPADQYIQTIRGYDEPHMLWIIRWNVAGGFEYR